MTFRFKAFSIALVLASVGLYSCVYLPMTTKEYDPDCGIIKRHMSLRTNQVEAFVGCQNEGCVELLMLAGVVSATTFVVSGSIAVVGDVVYWLEAKKLCHQKLRTTKNPEIEGFNER